MISLSNNLRSWWKSVGWSSSHHKGQYSPFWHTRPRTWRNIPPPGWSSSPGQYTRLLRTQRHAPGRRRPVRQRVAREWCFPCWWRSAWWPPAGGCLQAPLWRYESHWLLAKIRRACKWRYWWRSLQTGRSPCYQAIRPRRQSTSLYRGRQKESQK